MKMRKQIGKKKKKFIEKLFILAVVHNLGISFLFNFLFSQKYLFFFPFLQNDFHLDADLKEKFRKMLCEEGLVNGVPGTFCCLCAESCATLSQPDGL